MSGLVGATLAAWVVGRKADKDRQHRTTATGRAVHLETVTNGAMLSFVGREHIDLGSLTATVWFEHLPLLAAALTGDQLREVAAP